MRAQSPASGWRPRDSMRAVRHCAHSSRLKTGDTVYSSARPRRDTCAIPVSTPEHHALGRGGGRDTRPERSVVCVGGM